MALALTACQKEEFRGNEAEGIYTFEVSADNIATKATIDGDGNGTAVNRFIMEVYLVKPTELVLLDRKVQAPTADSPKSTSFNLTLIKDQEYKVLFWADKGTDAMGDLYYKTTENLQNVSFLDEARKGNNDALDAFSKMEVITREESKAGFSKSVQLTRPFGQVNFITTDIPAINNLSGGSQFLPTDVKVSYVTCTGFNVLTQTGTGSEDIEYTAPVYSAMDPATNPAKYTLSMDYMLTATSERETRNVVKLTALANGYELTTVEVINYPVQRNYRTNIIGKILTGDVTFNITIDPIFDGGYNNGEAHPVSINGEFYSTIQDAVNNVNDGDVIKVTTGTYNEVVNVARDKNFTLEAAGPNVVIAGLNNQSNTLSTTVKVKGITFDNSITAAGWFTGTAPNIAPCVGAWGGNLSFEDCAFIVAGTSGKETGVMTWWTTSDMSLSFNNCTFEGKDGHANARAMQIYGHVNMEVKNCTFNTKKDYTLKYVAQDGNVATFSNNTVNNSENFVELGSSAYPGTNYTANIYNNTLGEGVNTHIIANDENQTVNVDGNVSVIAEGVVKDANGNYIASSNEGITNVISAGVTTISLTPGTYIIPDDAKGKTLTFIGTGNPEDTKIATQDDGSYEGCDYSLDGATVTFEKITINTDSETYTGYARCKGTYKNCVINGTYTLYGDSKFENCTFNVSGDVYNIWTWGATNAKFDKCTFNSDGKAMLLYGTVNTNLTIENSVFNDKGGLTDLKAAIEIGDDYGKSYTLVVNNTVVNGYEINNKGINTGTTLWANKNSMPTDRLNVTVDGVKVY